MFFITDWEYINSIIGLGRCEIFQVWRGRGGSFCSGGQFSINAICKLNKYIYIYIYIYVIIVTISNINNCYYGNNYCYLLRIVSIGSFFTLANETFLIGSCFFSCLYEIFIFGLYGKI